MRLFCNLTQRSSKSIFSLKALRRVMVATPSPFPAGQGREGARGGYPLRLSSRPAGCETCGQVSPCSILLQLCPPRLTQLLSWYPHGPAEVPFPAWARCIPLPCPASQLPHSRCHCIPLPTSTPWQPSSGALLHPPSWPSPSTSSFPMCWVLAGTELIFFTVASMGLCFVFVLETVLIIQGCLHYC